MKGCTYCTTPPYRLMSLQVLNNRAQCVNACSYFYQYACIYSCSVFLLQINARYQSIINSTFLAQKLLW